MHRIWNNECLRINFIVYLYCGLKVCLKEDICYSACGFMCFENASPLLRMYSCREIVLNCARFELYGVFLGMHPSYKEWLHYSTTKLVLNLF